MKSPTQRGPPGLEDLLPTENIKKCFSIHTGKEDHEEETDGESPQGHVHRQTPSPWAEHTGEWVELGHKTRSASLELPSNFSVSDEDGDVTGMTPLPEIGGQTLLGESGMKGWNSPFEAPAFQPDGGKTRGWLKEIDIFFACINGNPFTDTPNLSDRVAAAWVKFETNVYGAPSD